MSLRTQLTDILPNLLPANPSEAIKGTELIKLLRLQLEGNYSDASLRYHFSIMSCDPASPIAKVDKGQGYYRRADGAPALSGAQALISMSQGMLAGLEGDTESIDIAMERVNKFRAIVRRYYELNSRFPFEFRDAFSSQSSVGNFWKFPEMALVDWQTGEDHDEATELDEHLLTLKQHLGLPPFRITAARLRIRGSLQSYREDFFQALSSAAWTQGAELVYATPITDEALADGLRALNAQYGVGVSSFGIELQVLDDLPGAAALLNAHPRETEALFERIRFDRIAAPHFRSHIDWPALESLRRESSEAASLLDWLLQCLETRTATSYVAE